MYFLVQIITLQLLKNINNDFKKI